MNTEESELLKYAEYGATNARNDLEDVIRICGDRSYGFDADMSDQDIAQLNKYVDMLSVIEVGIRKIELRGNE